MDKKAKAQLLRYADVSRQVRVGDEKYIFLFQHVMSDPDLEYPLFSDSTMGLKCITSTLEAIVVHSQNERILFRLSSYKIRFI